SRIKVGALPKQVRVQRSAESLVCADNQNQLFLERADSEKWMKSRVCPYLQRNENLIHQSSVRPSRQSVLLRFAHLGGSHHLHCFGDLRGVADRSYPAPYVLCIRHFLESFLGPITSRTLAHVESDLAPFRRCQRLDQTLQCGEKIYNRFIMRIESALELFQFYR